MQQSRRSHRTEPASIGWFFLGLFIPIVGLILWLAWLNDHPAKAKKAGTGALMSGLIIILATIGFAFFTVHEINTQSASQAKTASVSKEATGLQTATIAWNNTKDNRLSAFIDNFGEAMNQNYSSVSSTSNTSWFSENLSKSIKRNKPLSNNGKQLHVKWFPATHQADKNHYNIVAAYADTTQHILYLFALKANGQQKVFVSQKALNNGALMVSETANQNLKSPQFSSQVQR